jgi:hypothetical protein
MALGDLFPEEFRKEFSERSVERGTVIRTHFTETNPPKIKLYVVLGASNDKIVFGVVLINSQVNPNIFRNPIVRGWHVPISSSDYDFLQHDSFVDCTQVFEKGTSELLQSVTDAPEVIVGKLHDDDFEAIKRAIKSATTIAKVTKRRFGLA